MSSKPWLVVLGNKGVKLSTILKPAVSLEHNKGAEHANQLNVYPKNDDMKEQITASVGGATKEGNMLLNDLREKQNLNKGSHERTNMSRVDVSTKLRIHKAYLHWSKSYALKDLLDDSETQPFENIAVPSSDLANKSSGIETPDSKETEEKNQVNANALTDAETPKTTKTTTLSKAEKKANTFITKYPALGCISVVDRQLFFERQIDFVSEAKQLTLQDVKKHKRPGDSLLRLIIERMVSEQIIDSPTAQQIESNASLKRFLISQCKSEKVTAEIVRNAHETTDPSVEMTDEKYGDVVEAMLHKTFNLPLIHDIINHGRGEK